MKQSTEKTLSSNQSYKLRLHLLSFKLKVGDWSLEAYNISLPEGVDVIT